MVNSAKTLANAFLREYNLSKVSVNALRAVITKQGFTIVEYNGIADDENVAALLSALELTDYCRSSKGFTYADSKLRLVFVHEGLSDDEKLLVLAHEEGHIYCGHFSSAHIIGRNVIEEHEANEFAHYILHQDNTQKITLYMALHRRTCIAIALCIALIICGIITAAAVAHEHSFYGEYYITSTGNKYHTKDCAYVPQTGWITKQTSRRYSR